MLSLVLFLLGLVLGIEFAHTFTADASKVKADLVRDYNSVTSSLAKDYAEAKADFDRLLTTAGLLKK